MSLDPISWNDKQALHIGRLLVAIIGLSLIVGFSPAAKIAIIRIGAFVLIELTMIILGFFAMRKAGDSMLVSVVSPIVVAGSFTYLAFFFKALYSK